MLVYEQFVDGEGTVFNTETADGKCVNCKTADWDEESTIFLYDDQESNDNESWTAIYQRGYCEACYKQLKS